MNIKEAKEQIKNAIIAYFTKDERGEYIIAPERQRPVFVMGPPGIGKTAIMEQIAQELGIGILSYSMTHHTRQSALGLPFITKKIYDGTEYSVSEYTMSEIIASVYDKMESSGVKEGILFLDEINCVSETLAPVMLQFLQYKVFGRHRVPNGWIIVTAGNPPQFNSSVKEFDIVTWDRLKRIEVEPDFNVWKEYAYKKNIHPAIITYLEIYKSNFYKIETTVNGKSFVTARGWEDLSEMIYLYEKNGLKVDSLLIGQYLQNKKIADEFSIYYDLFLKYESDYQIVNILNGKVTDEIKNRAGSAKFDERLAVIGLLLDSVNEEMQKVNESEDKMKKLLTVLKQYKTMLKDKTPYEAMTEIIKIRTDELKSKEKAGNLSHEARRKELDLLDTLEGLKSSFKHIYNARDSLQYAVDMYNENLKEVKLAAKEAETHLSNMFKFIENVFGKEQEMLIAVTELTINYHSAMFISTHNCPEYFDNNKDLLFDERNAEILKEIETLELN